MSGGQSIGGTLTGGVQDISALLPLLGTEQCEDHVASALTNGYLYAAASPISLLGSLGVVRAGFKTFMCCISISPPSFAPWFRFQGAKLMADAGFSPQGVNLSLIMLDEERKRYCAEDQIDSMMKTLHLEGSSKLTVSAKSWRWNIQMIIFTALACIISIIPYIHLNLHGSNSLGHFVRWVFPIMRAIGGFLTATMIQLIIQTRLLVIVRKRLILDGLRRPELQSLEIDVGDETSLWVRYPALDQRCSLLERHVEHALNHLPDRRTPVLGGRLLSPFRELLRRIFGQPSSSHSEATLVPPSNDAEKSAERSAKASLNDSQAEASGIDLESPNQKCLEDLQRRITEANGNPLLMWILLVLLLVGLIASVGGYVGCFSAVQGSETSREALIWLGLEVSLSVIRFILWGLNPKSDDAPPIEFKLELDEHPPLPTCTRTTEHIEDERDLPLVRAAEFLPSITSYAGLLKQFSDPLLTLYYTLTWKRHTDVGQHNERTLFITIFDHTERTTRVYTESDLLDSDQVDGSNENAAKSSHFYSADPITVDLEQGVLKTRLGRRIRHGNDPIAMNSNLQREIAKHYQSILDQLNHRVRDSPGHDAFEDHWRLKFGETTSRMQRNIGRIHAEHVYEQRDHAYLEQGQLEAILRKMFRLRGKWIEKYTKQSSDAMDQSSGPRKLISPILENNVRNPPGRVGTYPKNDVTDMVKRAIQKLLVEERTIMEWMLVYEVHRWEVMLRICFQGMIDRHCSRGTETETAVRWWRAGLGERLEEGRQAMLARRASARSKNPLYIADDELAITEDIDCSWRSLFQQLTDPVVDTPVKNHLDKSMQSFGSWPVLPPMQSFAWELNYESAHERGAWQTWFAEKRNGMEERLHNELKDVEERLRRGFPLS